MERVHSRVQVPVSGMRAHLLTHPRLNSMVSWAGQNWGALQGGDYAALLRSHPVAGPIYELSLRAKDSALPDSGLEGMAEEVAGFAQQISDSVEGLQHFELPDKIIPPADVAAILIDLFIDFVKARLPGKAELAAGTARTSVLSIRTSFSWV